MITSTARWRWRIALAVIGALILTGLLAFDLTERGLVWRLFWELTGEEAPLAQVRGMVELSGNLVRPQPQVAANAAVDHAGVIPYGINTFLEQEVEPDKREQQMQMIHDAGFAWIRQQFSWEDIEIHGRGDFEDRRNVDAVGTVSAWEKYDHIVDLADQYDVRIIARLDNPPSWSRADPESGAFAPPDDLDDFVNFARTIAERYAGRIHHYQIWNEPNIYPEWGEANVDPAGYTRMLCAVHDALKAVDPSIVVISAALSPTVSLTGRDVNDFIFLQRMYDASVGACFDVMSVQGYGFFSGPTDQRLRPTTLNFARHLYIRDIMVRNGDEDKAVWISEAAWNPVGSPDVPDIPGRDNFGAVTQAQAAQYMPLAYQRAIEDWSWVGVVSYWFFKRANDSERGQPFYYFRMVEPDFTPLPIYETMRDHIANVSPILRAGVHQAEHWAITRTDERYYSDPDARFGSAREMTSAEFTAHGTRVAIIWRNLSPLYVTIDDGETIRIEVDHCGWGRQNVIHESLTGQTITVRLTSDTPFLLDEVVVSDRTREHLLPQVMAIGAVLLVGIGMIAGIRLGWLRL